ncbi:hypothetical protein, partial [Phyllobacterium salinisoli]|uniref:hypothetical protein n=1 Tax=Phyllobacterium salinisoli TaxID=1899321 RepID=UPI0011C0571E
MTQLRWSVDKGVDTAHEFGFSQNPTTVTGGVSSVTITGTGPNLQNGAKLPVAVYATPLDEGSKVKQPGSLALDFVQGSVQHGIGITGTDPIPLYAAQTLTATNANPSDQMSDIYWSAVPSDPRYTVVFNPDTSPVVNNTTSSTQVTVYGPNSPGNVTVSVYARSDNSSVPIGEKDFGLTAAGSVPAGKVLSVISLDGDPVTANTPHLLQASYRTMGGLATSGTVTWTIDPPVAGVSLGLSSTTTDAYGMSTNSIEYTGSGTATATVKVSAGTTPDIGTLQVDFAQTVTLPGAGTMTLTSTDGTDNLTEGQP